VPAFLKAVKVREFHLIPWLDLPFYSDIPRPDLLHQVCEFDEGDNAIEARAALKGIHGIMTNQQEEYSLEYPCHSPAEQRWFFMYVFRYEDNCKVHIVVIHMNITGQMLAEEKLQNSHDKLQLSVEERTANFVMTTEQMKREIRKQKK
jgi:hypothetical protein